MMMKINYFLERDHLKENYKSQNKVNHYGKILKLIQSTDKSLKN